MSAALERFLQLTETSSPLVPEKDGRKGEFSGEDDGCPGCEQESGVHHVTSRTKLDVCEHNFSFVLPWKLEHICFASLIFF